MFEVMLIFVACLIACSFFIIGVCVGRNMDSLNDDQLGLCSMCDYRFPPEPERISRRKL
jgi:hypothetical protein